MFGEIKIRNLSIENECWWCEKCSEWWVCRDMSVKCVCLMGSRIVVMVCVIWIKSKIKK